MSFVASNISRNIISPIIDFIYPPVCISCNQLLADGSQKVCPGCWNSIQCVTRELPLYSETKQKLLDSGVISDLVSAFVFEKEGTFQHIAHALKYNGYESLGRELGKQIGNRAIDWRVHADCVIPIPLHKVKRRERGFNQSDHIANGISSILGIPTHTTIVQRKKHTQTQTMLSMDERRKNVEDAFEIDRSKHSQIDGRVCLLVDDIITTGATLNSCAQELIKGGASQIIAASAALAQ